MSNELLFSIAVAALLVLHARRQQAEASASPHAAGKNQGTTVPGYWADVQ